MNMAKTVEVVSRRAHRCPLSPCQKTSLSFAQHSQIATYSTTMLLFSQLPVRNLARVQSRESTIRTHRNLSSTSQTYPLRRTALYDLHVVHKAKMVPFGGYSMPVQYADQTVSESHNWTREKASLFDVGHMYAGSVSVFILPVGERLKP
jgi:hypothetical protein